jgi:hypothetical protein
MAHCTDCQRPVTATTAHGLCQHCKRSCNVCAKPIPKRDRTATCADCKFVMSRIAAAHDQNGRCDLVPDGQAERVERYRGRAERREPLFA